MSNTIIQIRSSGVAGNVPATLQPGELAINYFDGQLFYGNSTSQSVPFATITEPAGLNGELQFNDSGSFGSDATLSFNGTTKTLTVSNLVVDGLNVKPQLVVSYNHANAAFDLANTLSGGTSTDGWARNAANAASSYANSAYLQANTATTNSATADQKAVTSGSYANSAYSLANTNAILAQAAFDKANTGVSISTDEYARNHANSSFIHANAAFAVANSGSFSTDSFARNQANSAYNQANTGTVLAQSAYDFANTLSLSGGSTIGITNDTTTNSEYYITFTNSTSGIVTSLSTSSPKLGYNPSTGTLKVESVDVTQNSKISSGSIENTTGSQFIVDSFSIDEIRSAFYQVQVESSGGHQMLNLNVLHDGSTANVTVFGNTVTSSSLGSFTATIVGSVLRVLFTPSVGAVVVSFIKNAIRKIAQLFPTGDLGYVADSPSVYYDLGYVGDSSTSSVDYGGLS
jgi:hypothetical protein